MYSKIKELARQRRMAKTEEEIKAVNSAMKELENENPEAYGMALEQLIHETAKRVEELTVAEQMGEVTKIVSMAYIAQNYFGKTRSWLAQKLNGNTVNGKTAQFSTEELATLKFALSDISKKLGSLSAVL